MRVYFCFIFIVLFSGCASENKMNYEGLKNYMQATEHGLLKEKQVNGIMFQLKYIPNDVLVYKDYTNLEKQEIVSTTIDSLKKIYNNNFTFVFTIAPAINAENKGDIMLGGINSLQDFRERVAVMNFELDQLIKLQIDEKTIAPSLVNLDNIYGLKDSRSFMVVFPRNLIPSKTNELIFSFEDNFFNTGINKFKFKNEDIMNVPKLIIAATL